MSKHDDQLFDLFRDSLKDYAPAAPDGMYDGIRSKMKKKSFFAFSWYQFNFWYLALASGAIITASTMSNETASSSQLAKKYEIMDELVIKPNNHLIASLDEDQAKDTYEDMISTSYEIVKKKSYIEEKVSIAPKGPHYKEVSNQVSKELNSDEPIEIVSRTKENTSVEAMTKIEAPEKIEKMYFANGIGKLKHTLLKSINDDESIVIGVPVPTKK